MLIWFTTYWIILLAKAGVAFEYLRQNLTVTSNPNYFQQVV
jgi:hypothetical protein